MLQNSHSEFSTLSKNIHTDDLLLPVLISSGAFTYQVVFMACSLVG